MFRRGQEACWKSCDFSLLMSACVWHHIMTLTWIVHFLHTELLNTSLRRSRWPYFFLQNPGEESGEITIVKADAWVEGPKPLAAHFVADVSNYTTAHKHYDGNGRLRNADGIFEAWRPAEWMTANKSADGTKSFVLSPNGVLTVKKGGLYYIYAQVGIKYEYIMLTLL